MALKHLYYCRECGEKIQFYKQSQFVIAHAIGDIWQCPNCREERYCISCSLDRGEQIADWINEDHYRYLMETAGIEHDLDKGKHRDSIPLDKRTRKKGIKIPKTIKMPKQLDLKQFDIKL